MLRPDTLPPDRRLAAPVAAFLRRAGLPCRAGLLLASLLCLGWIFWDGTSFASFDDEDVHLLGGKMLNQGGVLYRSFVDSHGPVIFMLTQLYGALCGWAAPNGARAIPVLAAIAAGGAIAASPALTGPRARMWGVTCFAGLLAIVWLRQGLFMVSYYPVAGAMAAFALAAFAVGAITGAKPSAAFGFSAGLSLALLVGCAYSYGPSAVLIAAGGSWAALREGHAHPVKALLAGAAAGAALILLYLLRFGDIGGYLAFHVAESQADYARYINFSVDTFWRSLIPTARPDGVIQTLAVLCTVLAFAGLLILDARRSAGRQRHRLAIALCVAGILLLNARGTMIFQDGSFLFAAIALLSITAARVLASLPRWADIPGSLAAALLLAGFHAAAHAALYTPYGLDPASMAALPRWPLPARSDAPVFARVRALVGPQEPILALTYQPSFYLLADRRPMDGFYTYFPWDADYARSPWFGIRRDLCAALTTRPPPLIVLDQVPIWGHRPIDYMPCLFAALRRDYVRDGALDTGIGQIYVRRDRAQGGDAQGAAAAKDREDMRVHLMVAASLLPGVAAQAAPPVTPIAAAIANPDRPPADRARDPMRHPGELVRFAGLRPGESVADFMPGGGYFTRIFSNVVGPGGHVYAITPSELAARMPSLPAGINSLAAEPAFGNVTPLVQPTAEIGSGLRLDMVWTSDNYHDVYGFFGAQQAAAADAAIFRALKPGGIFMVIDHVAAEGSGATAPTTLHRIDPEMVKTQVLAAGFQLEAQSDILHNPDDQHNLKVFAPAIRGHTDQFVFKFRKPGG
jgi:predicted methyltransferase